MAAVPPLPDGESWSRGELTVLTPPARVVGGDDVPLGLDGGGSVTLPAAGERG